MKEKVDYSAPHGQYGDAVTSVLIKEDGTMWVTNGEYSTRVNFCPFTGKPATTKMVVLGEGKRDSGSVWGTVPFVAYIK